MLTKRQTLLALPICLSAFFVFWAVGLISQELVFGRNVLPIVVVVGIGMIASAVCLAFAIWSTLTSYATTLTLASPLAEEYGPLFYYFLWSELQAEIRQRRADQQKNAAPGHYP